MLDYAQLDKVIHERGRLVIMTLLSARRSRSFHELKAELKMSDGNLITHLRTLHKIGYVAVTREKAARPRTSYAMTSKGKKTFRIYIQALRRIIKGA